MNEPMDRSRRVFGSLRSFEEVFPTLEDVIVEFNELDFVFAKRSGTWHIGWQGGLMPCGNESCKRGGYELDRPAKDMLRVGETEKNIKISCHGDEGSAKGQRIGRRCERSIEAKIMLKPKNDASVS